MRKLYFVLSVFASILLFSQKISIEKKFEKNFKKFDSLNNLKSTAAKLVLDNIKSTKDFRENDTLKIMYYTSLGTFYIVNRNFEKTKKNCDECIKISKKIKAYNRAAKCQHNLAVFLHISDKISDAIAADQVAMEYAKLGNDEHEYYKALVANAGRYSYLGDYLKSNKTLIGVLPRIKDKETNAVATLMLTRNYDALGDKKKLDHYFLNVLENLKNTKYKSLLNSAILDYCNYLIDRGEYKKSNLYADSIVHYSKTDEALSMSKWIKARSLLGLKDYDKALKNINEAIAMDQKNYDAYSLLDDYNTRGKIYLALGKLDPAISDFKTAKSFFKEVEDKILEVEVFENSLIAHLRRNDPFISKEFEKYVALKDSIYDGEQSRTLIQYETENRTLEKEAQIKSQKLELEKQTANRNYALSGIGALLLLSGAGFIYFRNKKKREDLQKQNTMLSLQKSLNEMQLQNLNKQLNPHEVKNLLAGLSLEMQEKAPQSYENMVRFFNLTKASLYNDSLTESLEIQLKQAEDFIVLEKQMLTEPIDFKIVKDINTEKVEIPRLLIKNLLENAVKHGIKGNENGGSILLKLFEVDGFINVEVDDTGKGRKYAIASDSGIGTSTYIKLFETLNKSNDRKASFQILDKEIGTKVVVKIPLQYNYH